jgi:IclR family acetate operon transcriptional repressor
VAALALVGPAARLDDAALVRLGPQVAEAAAALGAALGGPVPRRLPSAPRKG